METLKSFFTKKTGPLANWLWIAIAVAVVIAVVIITK